MVGLMITQRSTTCVIYLHDAFPQLGVLGIGIFFVLNPLMIVLLQTSLINAYSRVNKLLLVGLGAFLIGFGLWVLSFSFVFFLVIFSSIIYTLGEMFFFSVAQLVCYNNSPAHKKGESFGFFKTIYAASRTVGPTLGTLMYTHLGGDINWYACGVMGCVCLLGCLYYKNSQQS